MNTVLRGLLISGHTFGAGMDNAPSLAGKVAENMLALCRREQLAVDDGFAALVRKWVNAEPA